MSELKDRQYQFVGLIGLFIVWMYEQGYTARFGDAWRSTDKLYVPTGEPGLDDDEAYSYQELLFYNKATKVTYGKHNDRLAIDLLIAKDGKDLIAEEYRPLGEKWESLGGKWGGRFGVKKTEYAKKVGWDSNHFEI